jgi:hypothetical protein
MGDALAGILVERHLRALLRGADDRWSIETFIGRIGAAA